MYNNNDAVSPVIGVMLMLVVTLIIAAVVSAFAGGMATTQETTPQASIEVRLAQMDDTMGGVKTAMTFEHLSGDTINSGDLQIITYYTVPSNGTIIKHAQTAASPPVDLYGYGSMTRVPFLNDHARVGYSSSTTAWFGNYTFMPGDILSTGNDVGTSDLLGFNITDNDYTFGSGSIIEVKLLHIPSEKYIYDGEVIVA
jgi:FlaG/FlaF family flagellin (archaellin)